MSIVVVCVLFLLFIVERKRTMNTTFVNIYIYVAIYFVHFYVNFNNFKVLENIIQRNNNVFFNNLAFYSVHHHSIMPCCLLLLYNVIY